MIADDKQRQNEINKKIKQAMVKWYQYSVMKSETLLHTVGIFFFVLILMMQQMTCPNMNHEEINKLSVECFVASNNHTCDVSQIFVAMHLRLFKSDIFCTSFLKTFLSLVKFYNQINFLEISKAIIDYCSLLPVRLRDSPDHTVYNGFCTFK